MDLVKASATSKVFNLATGVSSLIIFAIHAKVLYAIAIPITISNILGNIIGTKLAIKIGPDFVRKILIISMVILLATLIWNIFSIKKEDKYEHCKVYYPIVINLKRDGIRISQLPRGSIFSLAADTPRIERRIRTWPLFANCDAPGAAQNTIPTG